MSFTKDDVTDEELKMVELMRGLKAKPVKMETAEDLVEYMKYCSSSSTVKTSVEHPQTPKISTFYGEQSKGQPTKGEVGYDSFKYEIDCLVHAGTYTEASILNAIRRACKGTAADIIRRLGVKASLKEVIDKFDATYSQLETPESIMRKFYSCSQNGTENVTAYAERVEDLFSKAVEMGALLASQDIIMKNVLYQGLRPQLRQMATFKYDLIKDYSQFKVELRKIESQLEDDVGREAKSTTCHANQMEKDSKLVDILEKLNARIERLEKKDEENSRRLSEVTPSRNANTDLRYQGRGYGRGRGQDRNYRPGRPTAGNTFRPRGNTRKCFKCGSEQHMIKDCPN